MLGGIKDEDEDDEASKATRWATAAPLPRQRAKDIQVLQHDKKRRARTGRGDMRRARLGLLRWLAWLGAYGEGRHCWSCLVL